ncbi:hypothetical protein ACFQX6_59385 [Streptosporangium lutulentum]
MDNHPGRGRGSVRGSRSAWPPCWPSQHHCRSPGWPRRRSAAPVVSTASTGGGTAAQWTTRTVAPGVEVRTGTIRNPAATPGWTVTVQAAVTSRFGTPAWAVVGTESWASETVSRLRAAASSLT